MKFAAAYYLLLIYSTVILKPLIPVAEDALMHCFGEAWHIATVHAAEGSNHVEKEISASGANDDSSKNQKTDKTEQAIHETAINYALIPLNPCPSIRDYAFRKESVTNIYIDFINPPPRTII
jgi:hypothetical protein